MSLLQSLPYKEYQKALRFTKEQCEQIAKLAKLRNAHYHDVKKPGEQLIKDLDRRGYSVNHYYNFLSTFANECISSIYKPKSKVAILIGNNDYKKLSKLATPTTDCDILAENLKSLGFIAISVKNVTALTLKDILNKVFAVVPPESYCFVFYAGHGFELRNIKFLLDIESPLECIAAENVMTENEILSIVSKCQPEFCILLMDMCRIYLDEESCPQLWLHTHTQGYAIENLLVAYSTQSAMPAYEEIQIELSKTIDLGTYEIRSCDLGKIVPGSSQYVNTLCKHIRDYVDVGTLLDRVHDDLESAVKKQTPTKVQVGVAKRSLHDPIRVDKMELSQMLKEAVSGYQEFCTL